MTITWGAMWYSKNKISGETKHLLNDDRGIPALFPSRKEAREWINKRYGYIRFRKDLRREPHGWRFPRPVRVEVRIL